MMKIILYILVILEIINVNYAQRVAPGVPPQHYQQQQHVPQHPHMQQQQQHQQQHINQMPIQQQQPMHQVPIQQQQPPQQMHQVPVQQQTAPQQMHPPVQQVPIQQQQVPVQAHHGHHGQHNGQILNAANIAHEKEHIAEHMDIPMDTSNMSEQELQFHYFKMHDADNNNKLDGCELIKSLIHWHGTNEANSIVPSQSDAELKEIVDPLLQTMDINLDGYVDYAEFKMEMGI